VQAVQADDEQVDVDAALDRGGPGAVDHGQAGSRDPAVLHLASEPAGVRVIADHQCPLRHASFVPEPDLSPEGDHAPSMDGRLCRSRRIIAKHGCLRHRGRRLGNRGPQEDRGRAAASK